MRSKILINVTDDRYVEMRFMRKILEVYRRVAESTEEENLGSLIAGSIAQGGEELLSTRTDRISTIPRIPLVCSPIGILDVRHLNYYFYDALSI